MRSNRRIRRAVLLKPIRISTNTLIIKIESERRQIMVTNAGLSGFFRLSLPDEECGGESRLAALRDPPCHQRGPGGREQNENTAISARRGVPAPMSWRISNDRLWPATWSRYRLCTFSRPRSQVRRMPPRSRLWAKQRSTISARSLKASRATPDLSRARLSVTARRAASSPCQREKPVCLGAAIRVFQGLSFRALKTARE